MTRFVSVEVDDTGRLRVEAEGFAVGEVARFVAAFDQTWAPASPPLDVTHVAAYIPMPASLADDLTNDLPSAKTTKPTKASKPKTAKDAAVGPPLMWHCEADGCNRTFGSKHAMSVHKARAHRLFARGGIVPSPKPVVVDADNIRAWRLRCADCDYTASAEDLKAMRQHTMTNHGGRLPSTSERTPGVA